MLPKSDFDLSLVYAALFLMGRPAQMEYVDVGGLHGIPLALLPVPPRSCPPRRGADRETDEAGVRLSRDQRHAPRQDFRGLLPDSRAAPSKLDMEERVRRAKATWVERKRHALLPEGRALDGHQAP